jgi:hypothetical protein
VSRYALRIPVNASRSTVTALTAAALLLGGSSSVAFAASSVAPSTTVTADGMSHAAKTTKIAKSTTAKASTAKTTKTAKSTTVKKAATKATKATKATTKTYADNLDGWIKESLDILHAHNIPASYHGIYKNVMRESSGDPNVVNDWDINAQNGIPSKGLLQVIQPTFDTYHIAGTADSLTDPVANITAACNYAYHRYGTIDNVNSAY